MTRMPPGAGNETNAPIARDAYDALAEGYAALAETKAENGFNEHPAMRACIGDVKGLTVLDAGCGPGFLLRDLLAAGARRVCGFDVSANMVAIARKRVGGAATIWVGDLAGALPLADNSLDLVVSSLALDYVYDWSVPLAAFKRVLTPKGRLVFSVQHPLGSYEWLKPATAFGRHLCETRWRGFTDKPVTVPDYYRSVEEIFNPVLQAGFHLTHVHETRPVAALKQSDPRKYERGHRFATFMIIDAQVTPSNR
ncbi:MAG: class I SAM-dependent methyltransferase [Pseudomonadota bacterium]